MRDRDPIDGKSVDKERFWCPYSDLEEFHAGMWKTVSAEGEQDKLIALAVSLLRNPARFSAALDRVLGEWPTSCKAEFTSPGNHLAWLGQASCCIEHGVPESLTRRAWWKLLECERGTADKLAASAVSRWASNVQSRQLSIFDRISK